MHCGCLLVDPAELQAGGEIEILPGVVCVWASALAALLAVTEVLSGTVGVLSLLLLGRAEDVSEHIVTSLGTEVLIADSHPQVVIMPVKQTNEKKPTHLFPPPIQGSSQMFSLTKYPCWKIQ